ncbi:unnamed protein product [Nezara viridula]|uniref:Anticodon-binding domain-containing protein n=1 Tax=Nezara viridula TaxID=85310 RepID=A0A9P0GWR0_NEZVI|nr:unnamed protein product [Nezara viridula]
MNKVTNDVLKKIIKHAEDYGFLKIIENNGICEYFTLGPAGQLLSENIRKEWMYSNVTHRENNVFTFKSLENNSNFLTDIREPYKIAKNYINSECPFGLVDIGNYSVENDSLENKIIYPRKHQLMRYFAILPPKESEQFFYRYQQQRKRWWRKFSLDPGRFRFEEIEKCNDNIGLIAKIGAEYPWGFHCLETVHYHGGLPFQNISLDDVNIFSVRVGKKRCLPHIVECKVNLDYAIFSYFCDAFTTKRNKIILKFHRKMAPFKFSFACDDTSVEESKTLHEIAELMCLELRKAGLHCLLPSRSDFTKKLYIQLIKSDSLGIPYTAVVTNETLNNGIFGLYSRDTTLQEQVHMGKMAEYGELLMKNY